MNSNQLVSIEGNIGSGKSTLLSELEHIYKDNKKVVFLKEPLDEWEKIKDENGITMLQKFYKDQEKYSFPFQMMAFISRLSILKAAMKENTNAIIITERSLFTDKFVFAKMLYDQKYIETVNYQIYLNWFDEFAKEFPVNNIIYVKTDPSICHERICKRSRTGEGSIPLVYLENCHQYHEKFLEKEMKCHKLVLNGNNDIFENNEILNNWIMCIRGIIDGKIDL